MSWMRTLLVMSAAAVLVVGDASAQEEGGTEVTVSADLVSAYVFRGVTLNDGLALQPGVKVGGLPITFGVWGNLDIGDYDGMLVEGEFSEIDIFASYDIPIEIDLLGLSVGYTEYTYPSGGGDADRELSLSIGLKVPLAPTLGLYYGIDGGIEKTLYAEASVGHDVELCEVAKLSLKGAVAYVSPDEGEDGFSHYTASADLCCWSLLTVGVTYVGQIEDGALPDYVPGTTETDASLGYDVEVIGKVGIAAAF